MECKDARILMTSVLWALPTMCKFQEEDTITLQNMTLCRYADKSAHIEDIIT